MSAEILRSSPVLHAARDFAKRVGLSWPLRGALLFGSQARGSAHAGSDTDVAVLLTAIRVFFTISRAKGCRCDSARTVAQPLAA